MGQYDFDFSKYDVGGYNAIRGDGKLTGDEVKKAQKDGFTNVWEGFTDKDEAPVNINEAKAEEEERQRALKEEEERKKHAFNFDEYDVGGNDAIPGDGQLTGDEAKRAQAAGYTGIYDGIPKEYSAYISEKDEVGTPFCFFTRLAARNTTSKLLMNTAGIIDMVLFPLEFPTSLIQRLICD